jgi:hypothetical protein
MAVQIQLRRDSKADWASVNPILGDGEIGHESDTYDFKIGDGVTAWNDLDYYSDPNIRYISSATGVTPTDTDDFISVTGQNVAITFNNPAGSFRDFHGIVTRVKAATGISVAFGTQYRPIDVTLPTTVASGKTMFFAMSRNQLDSKWDVFAVRTES